jgi:site-specific recombinase
MFLGWFSEVLILRTGRSVRRGIQQEALTRLLVEKGIFSKEEFLKMVKVVNLEIAKMV